MGKASTTFVCCVNLTIHRQNVLVCCCVGHQIDRCKFVLCWRDFVVRNHGRNAKFPRALLKVLEKCVDPRRNGSEVVEVSVLAARGGLTDERATAVHQVGSTQIHLAVDHEKL